MSAATDDAEVPPPRATTVLFGHAEAERILLDSYRGGRSPHGWLIAGPPGIGKATLAYRMARFVLAHPDPRAAAVQSAATLGLPADHRVVCRVAAQGHSDLFVLERTINEKTGKLRQDIQVEDVRDAVNFFRLTAGEGGWRVGIVDCVDELNAAGANALLKILEEPPPSTLLLLVTHSARRVLSTIRSRCRVLALRPLSGADVERGLAAALGRDAEEPDLREAAALAQGSIGRALTLLDGPALALRKRVAELLDRLPDVDPQALHALGDALGGYESKRLTNFADTVNEWLAARLAEGEQQPDRMVRIAETWDKINQATQDVDIYNLERKPLVFSVFGWLAQAARA